MQAGALAAGVESALAPLGFPRERRAWHGHVTLGRFRDPEPCPPGLVDRARKFGEARADRLVLFRSELTPEGALHSELASLPLGGGSVPAA
jgi:2'-5' RNA ligase